jgi:hypothetical protein
MQARGYILGRLVDSLILTCITTNHIDEIIVRQWVSHLSLYIFSVD